MLDYPHEYETSASMMTAIKCQDDRVGERGARAEWIWEFWQDRWKFRPDSEVWGTLFILLCVDLSTDISHSMPPTLFICPVRQPEDQRDGFIRHMCPYTLPHRVSAEFIRTSSHC